MLIAHDPIERLRRLCNGEAVYQFYLQNRASSEVQYIVYLTSIDTAFILGMPPAAEKWEPILLSTCTRLSLI